MFWSTLSFFILILIGLVALYLYAIQNYPFYEIPSEDVVERPPTQKECIVTGCSGQVCADEEVITTCEFKPQYACFRTAKCERQSDGKCDWTMTEELATCLAEAEF